MPVARSRTDSIPAKLAVGVDKTEAIVIFIHFLLGGGHVEDDGDTEICYEQGKSDVAYNACSRTCQQRASSLSTLRF